jgi:hypothetical protein
LIEEYGQKNCLTKWWKKLFDKVVDNSDLKQDLETGQDAIH